jgi:hypothetical protein
VGVCVDCVFVCGGVCNCLSVCVGVCVCKCVCGLCVCTVYCGVHSPVSIVTGLLAGRAVPVSAGPHIFAFPKMFSIILN